MQNQREIAKCFEIIKTKYIDYGKLGGGGDAGSEGSCSCYIFQFERHFSILQLLVFTCSGIIILKFWKFPQDRNSRSRNKLYCFELLLFVMFRRKKNLYIMFTTESKYDICFKQN